MKISITALYKRYIRIIPGVRSYVLVTVFVFAIGICITMFSWYVDKQRIESQKTLRLNQQAISIENDITNQLSIYEQILRGARGLFKASDLVTREDWHRFVQQYDLEKSYPGINGLGYIQYVPGNSIEEYTAAARAEFSPEFAVIPSGARSDYALVKYFEPMTPASSRAIGFDVLSDPQRRQAADTARDSGEVSISDKIIFVSDTTGSQPGYAMYVPIYNKDSQPDTPEERQANLEGYVFAGYRADNFFNRAIDKTKLTAYSSVQVFDGKTTDKNALLYQSKNFEDSDPGNLSRTFTINVFDRDWTYRFAGPIVNDNNDQQRSNMILIGGLTMSCAIAGFLFLMMLTRARAIVYAKQHETQQAKDDLLSLASHQLRTPATAVKQYLGMILEGYTGKVNKKQEPALQKAYNSNERQLDTINQILYVAKADAGRLSINKRNFNLARLIDDVALDLEDMLEEKDQSVVIKHSNKRLRAYADEASLRMVVENLISNAAKYSYSDSKITIQTGTRGREVYISISDQGVGIAKDDFDKLFKKFSRIDNDLSLQVGGSGIGLYIDKVLIELHGGWVDVSSDIGQGSTFTIYLPMSNKDSKEGRK